MKNDLETLAILSRRLGSDPALAQGGGGNTSLKTADRMWIKASGLCLADVTAQKGFVAVKDAALRDEIADAQTEEDYIALLEKHQIGQRGRPSIETGFHAFLGAAVLHSHSVWANLLCCAEEGPTRLRAICPSALWVSYASPGLPLVKTLRAVLPEEKKETLVLFLENHGLIVSAPTLEEAWQRHQAIDAQIRDAFSLPDNAFETFFGHADADVAHLLFPDQVVYLSQTALAQTPAGRQVQKAYSFIRQMIERCGLTPHYLPREAAEALLAMESEKYRQKMSKK